MLRSRPFRQPERAPRVYVMPVPSKAFRNPAPAGQAAPPVPKFIYYRSPKLLKACSTLACQHCGAKDGTIVPAHSNWACHGKGKGIKASDQYVAALCCACHMELDQGKAWTEAQRKAVWWAAFVLTVRSLVLDRLWPARVPIPDTGPQAAVAFLEA